MRPMLQVVQKKFGQQKLVGAEIGVQRGAHAFAMLNNLSFKELVLVDIWRSVITKSCYSNIKRVGKGLFPDKALIDKANDEFYPLVLKRFGKRGNVTILRKYSVVASKTFPNNHFDFVYIDACHKYDAVKEDIENWLPKVKPGGILGGHDYYCGHSQFPGLVKAIHNFIKQSKYKLYYEKSDWWIIKGE